MSVFETDLPTYFQPGHVFKTLSSTPGQPPSSLNSCSSRAAPARRPRGGESSRTCTKNTHTVQTLTARMTVVGKLQECFTRTTVATTHRTPPSVAVAAQVAAQVRQTSAVTRPAPTPLSPAEVRPNVCPRLRFIQLDVVSGTNRVLFCLLQTSRIARRSPPASPPMTSQV